MLLRLSRRPEFQPDSGAPLALAGRDAALLAWLALEGPTARGRLAQLMWPDRDDDAARNSLRQRLFQLRRQLGVEIVSGGTTLALAAGVAHDLEEADDVLGAGTVSVGPEFDAWLERQRERRRGRVRLALADLCEMAESAGDWPDALAHAHELLALDPLAEEGHRRLMRLHYLAGDRAAALLVFDRCERTLKDEVGTRPSAATLALLATIEGPAAQTRGVVWVPGAAVPVAVSRPPRLIGREAELAQWRQGWETRRTTALIGEAGMGKSRLLQTIAGEHPGLVGAAARPGDAAVPLSTLARLLQAAGGPGLHAEGGVGEIDRPALLVRLRAWFDADTAPTGLYVDDLHFADAASLDIVRQLVAYRSEDRPEEGPHWTLAFRPAEAGSAVRALQKALDERAALVSVAITPLDEAALAELVDSLALPGLSGAALAPGLLRRTGGNPLFVLETLKQAWVERRLDGLAERPPRPGSVMRLIDRRLGQLSAPALMLARCAAVAGSSFSPGLAAQVLRVHALALADAWSELEQAQILRDQAFAHDLYHEAAEASVPAPIARLLHADVAAYLAKGIEGPADPALLARHWLAAGRPLQALAPLEAAAQRATAALDPASAAAFLAQLADARAATGDVELAFEAALDAATAARSLGSGPDLERAIDHMDELARTPRQQAAAFESRGVMHHMRGDSATAAHWVARGLDALGPDGDVAARIVLLNLHGVVLRRANRLQGAREALEEALALARERPADAAADLPAVLNNLALVLQEMDDHLGAIGLLQESAGLQPDVLVRARVLNNLGTSLEERGQAAMAYEQRLAAARLSASAKSPGVADLVLSISLCANARQLARFRAALAHLEQARQLAARIRHFREEDLHRHAAALWLDLGRANQAREAIEAAEADPGAAAAHIALVRARYAMQVGQDARTLLDDAERALRRSGELRTLRRLLVCKAQVLEPADAVKLLAEWVDDPQQQDNAGALLPAQVRMAQALLALGRLGEAERRAQRAADALGMAHPLDMSPAEVWLTLARVWQARGETMPAAVAADTGRRWVEQVAATQLDEPYRDGYLNRNRVNSSLRILAAQLGPAAQA